MTVAFSSALSHAGVKYLAASPETMLAPGVPTQVAHDIAAHENDPAAMARAIVKDAMHTRYGMPGMGTYAPAAAMDVLDLDPQKVGAIRTAVKTLDGVLTKAARGSDAAAGVPGRRSESAGGEPQFLARARPRQ